MYIVSKKSPQQATVLHGLVEEPSTCGSLEDPALCLLSLSLSLHLHVYTWIHTYTVGRVLYHLVKQTLSLLIDIYLAI